MHTAPLRHVAESLQKLARLESEIYLLTTETVSPRPDVRDRFSAAMKAKHRELEAQYAETIRAFFGTCEPLQGRLDALEEDCLRCLGPTSATTPEEEELIRRAVNSIRSRQFFKPTRRAVEPELQKRRQPGQSEFEQKEAELTSHLEFLESFALQQDERARTTESASLAFQINAIVNRLEKRNSRLDGLQSGEANGLRIKQAKTKASTAKGDARVRIIAALTKHHRYSDGRVLNLEPVNNNELARRAKVDKATASAFFKSQFKGHAEYKVRCRDENLLLAFLKMLNKDFAPFHLYANAPQAKDDDEDDEDDEDDDNDE